MHTYDQTRHEWRYDIGGFAWDNGELGKCTILSTVPYLLTQSFLKEPIFGFGSPSSVQAVQTSSASHRLWHAIFLRRIRITLVRWLDLVQGITLVIGEMAPKRHEFLEAGWEDHFILSRVRYQRNVQDKRLSRNVSGRAHGRYDGFDASSWPNDHGMGSTTKGFTTSTPWRTWSTQDWTWLDCFSRQLVYKVGENCKYFVTVYISALT